MTLHHHLKLQPLILLEFIVWGNIKNGEGFKFLNLNFHYCHCQDQIDGKQNCHKKCGQQQNNTAGLRFKLKCIQLDSGHFYYLYKYTRIGHCNGVVDSFNSQ